MDYGRIKEDAKQRLQELAAQREAIDREMQAVARIIEGTQIVSQPPEPLRMTPTPEPMPENKELGVTEAVRLVLTRARIPLLPTEIRDALEGMGVEASSSKVLLIHVHNVLRRLFEAGQIEQEPRDGKMGYRTLTIGDVIGRVLNPIGIVMNTPIAQRENEVKEPEK